MDSQAQICLSCARLGKCSDATIKKLLELRGCGSWVGAPVEEIAAREKAIEVAGYRALEALLLKSPPSKPAKNYRR